MADSTKIGFNMSRRQFVAGTAGSIATLAAAGRGAGAQDLPMLAEDDPTAIALKYVADAGKADQAVRQGDDRFCRNCALFAGDADAANAPCSIFPGKLVSANGWCSVWAPKQSG